MPAAGSSPPGASPSGPAPPGRRAAPPARAERLLTDALPTGLVGETILGDLHQEFDERTAEHGANRARVWYWAVVAELALRYRLRAVRHRSPYRFRDDASPRSHPMSDLTADLRYGFRMLRKTPMISLAAILTIAVGVGMTVHTFSIVYGSVLRGVPLPEQHRLLQVRADNPETGGRNMMVPFPDYLAIRERAESFDWVASQYETSVNMAGEGGHPERYGGAVVSADALARLGVAPHLGRVFVEGEDRAGADPVLVISWELWRTRFGADPDIVGATVRANGEQTRIVGVMPEGFHFPFNQDVWLPDRRDARARENHDQQWVAVFGHLQRGTGIGAATAELEALFDRLRDEHAQDHRPLTAYALPYEDVYMPPEITLPIKLQLLAVLGVLLIACANVANLLLARSAIRSREIAVRAALGASRWRIVRQLLFETLGVAAVGGILGVALARMGVALFNAGIEGIQRPYWIDVRVDTPAIAVALAATLGATLLSGLLPALRATGRDAAGALRDEARGSSLRLGRLSHGLVVAQVAVSAALLVMAGLMVKSIVNANNVELGFRTQDVLTSRISPSEADYPDTAARRDFARELLEGLRGSPAVTSAAVATSTPGLGSMVLITSVDGHVYASDADHPQLSVQGVSDGYFEILDVPVLRGRTFAPEDSRQDAEAVTIVSESLARRFFPEGALDRRLRIGTEGMGNRWMRIVGVVPDLHVGGGVGGIGNDRVDSATYYLPIGRFNMRSYTVLARGEVDAVQLVPVVRSVVGGLDPDMPIYEVASLAQAIESATWAFEVFGGLFGSLGLVALFLAAVGLYGVMSFTVARRTREVGIRMALGAQSRDVLRLVVSRAARQLGIGLAVGLGIGALISRPLAPVTFAVSPGDPSVYLAILLLLASTGILASLLPARRATRVDPSEALRSD